MDAKERTGAHGELMPVVRVLNEPSSPDLVIFFSVSQKRTRGSSGRSHCSDPGAATG